MSKQIDKLNKYVHSRVYDGLILDTQIILRWLAELAQETRFNLADGTSPLGLFAADELLKIATTLVQQCDLDRTSQDIKPQVILLGCGDLHLIGAAYPANGLYNYHFALEVINGVDAKYTDFVRSANELLNKLCKLATNGNLAWEWDEYLAS